MTIDEVLTRGVSQVLPSRDKLAEIMAERKITLYQGFDPSMPSLHLGNFVGLMKLRQFQRLGHKVIFLVGDFTGMIGDPSDKLSVRKMLTRDEAKINAKDFEEQASKLLDFDGPNPAKILFNSDWLDKVTFKDLLEITSKFTVGQMIERDMFQERIKKNAPIYLHEFLYPIAQAIDAFKMDVDLEIGGSDQLFNMMAGRTLMKAAANKEKYVLTTKLLVDSDGQKVGKTTGNALFMNSTPENFYSGIMSFPDDVLPLAFELLTEVSLDGIEQMVKKEPMAEKKKLAYEVVKLIWGEEASKGAEGYFEKTFQKRETPEEVRAVKISETRLPLLDLVFASGLSKSRSEAKRLINQGAIDIDGKEEKDPAKEIEITKRGLILRVGKSRFVKIVTK